MNTRQFDGYYFTATGVSSHEFFSGDQSVCRVIYLPLPGGPLHIQGVGDDGATIDWSLSDRPRPNPGAEYRLTEGDGERAWIHLWGYGRITLRVDGAAIEGRAIESRPIRPRDREFLFRDGHDEIVARIRMERGSPRMKYGEWFSRRYVAEVSESLGLPLQTLALSAPFIGLGSIGFD